MAILKIKSKAFSTMEESITSINWEAKMKDSSRKDGILFVSSSDLLTPPLLTLSSNRIKKRKVDKDSSLMTSSKFFLVFQ